MQQLLVSNAEREEADLERRIRAHRGVTRPNTIALISPKGGVGKTTSTFVVGNLLATHMKLRAIAVDANPDFGTLARLAPDDRRAERSLADLLDDAERLRTAAELGPYVSRLSTGLHVLGAPSDAALTASLGPERYGELAAFLSTFYDVVLLDLGTGVAGPLARFAIERADQIGARDDARVGHVVGGARRALASPARPHDRRDQPFAPGLAWPSTVIEDRFRAEHLHRAVTIPHDEQFAAMLDSGTYALDALRRDTRLAIKRLGLAVAEQLV